MIGLDTNVLARYLAQDDAKQAALATRLIKKRTWPYATRLYQPGGGG